MPLLVDVLAAAGDDPSIPVKSSGRTSTLCLAKDSTEVFGACPRARREALTGVHTQNDRASAGATKG